LQEESGRDNPKRDFKKAKADNSSFRYSGKPRVVTFNSAAQSQTNSRGADISSNQNKKIADNTKGFQSEDKAATLMAYRKAKGLCYKGGMKWNLGHKCLITVYLLLWWKNSRI
jgi:hypothetical protein